MDNEREPFHVFDNFLFPKIFQTFRMAIQPSKLIIGLLAVTVICLAGWIMDLRRPVIATPQTQAQETELQIYMANPDKLKSYIENYKETGDHTGVFSTLWHFASERFHKALKSLFAFNLPGIAKNIAECFKALRWALRHHLIYCIIFSVIGLAATSIAGGSLCRSAALQFAKGEKPGLTEALRFSTKKFTSFFLTPLAPVGIIIFIGFSLFLLGLLGNIPRAGELIMGIFMPLAFLAGVLITVVLIGTVAGFNLMFPAIAYEGSDCFDAISRSFSYVYAKPWRMGFYTTIAAVYGAICYTFVRFFAFLLLLTTHLFVRLGVWAENSKEVNKLAAIWSEPRFMNLSGSSSLAIANWSQSIGAFLINLLLLIVVGLVVSFVISFYFSANTIIYSLMRNRVDNTALEDIFSPSEDIETESAATEPPSDQPQPQNSEQ
jgi:hypothetical protein